MPTDLITRLSTSEPTRELADEVLLAFGWSRYSVAPAHIKQWLGPDGSHNAACRPNPLTDLNAAVALESDPEKQRQIMVAGLDMRTGPFTVERLCRCIVIACLKAREMNDAG